MIDPKVIIEEFMDSSFSSVKFHQKLYKNKAKELNSKGNLSETEEELYKEYLIVSETLNEMLLESK